MARASEFELQRQLDKIGTPIDKDEWLMLPQTVNAYYHPLMNEIVFPAAILQPPFFDPDADDAANYGGIGAVIGHEIGHGFDDQGSRYDATGARPSYCSMSAWARRSNSARSAGSHQSVSAPSPSYFEPWSSNPWPISWPMTAPIPP